MNGEDHTAIAVLETRVNQLDTTVREGFGNLSRQVDNKIDEVKEEIVELNGAVKENTRWRYIMIGAGTMVTFFLGTGFVTILAVALISSWG